MQELVRHAAASCHASAQPPARINATGNRIDTSARKAPAGADKFSCGFRYSPSPLWRRYAWIFTEEPERIFLDGRGRKQHLLLSKVSRESFPARFPDAKQQAFKTGPANTAAGTPETSPQSITPANGCVIHRRRQQRCGMWRQKTVHDREPRQHRKAHENRRPSAASAASIMTGSNRTRPTSKKTGIPQGGQDRAKPRAFLLSRISPPKPCPVRLPRRSSPATAPESHPCQG